MNLLLQADAFKSNFVYFSESKPNALFDGTYTKVNYCNDFFTMNGIHISLSNVRHETIVRIEADILNAYTNYMNKPTIKTTKLADTKYGAETYLKITGVWENTNGEIGLSYKILL